MCESSEEPPILAVGGVIYRWNTEGQIEFLLIKKQFGFWTFPKGQVKPFESDQSAVEREIGEETGLTGTIEEAVRQVRYTIVKKNKPRCKVVTYYLMHVQAGELHLSAKEHIRKARWFSVRAALRRIKRGRVRKVAQQASEMLAKRGLMNDNAL